MRKTTFELMLAVALISVCADRSVASAATSTALSSLRVTVVGTPVQTNAFAGASEYDRTNISSRGGYAHTDVIDIELGGGTRGRAFGLRLQAPTGQTFHRGTYYGDDVYGVRGEATVREADESCDDVRFTITDIASTGSTVTRLDVRFQSYCGGFISSVDGTLFGELSFGVPSAVPNTVTGARSFAWPDIPVGASTPAPVPLWVRNTADTSRTVGQVSRSGADSADFRFRSDDCTGHTLAPHTACRLQVVFHPTAAGRRSATITLPIGGKNLTTAVTGIGSPGTTLLQMRSPAGEYVGDGRDYLITNRQEQMRVGTTGPERFVGEVGDVAHGPEIWTVQITAPRGKELTPGSYPTTREAEFDYSGWALDVSGDGRGCNEATGHITIKQVTFNADNAPTAFDASFRQTCQDSGSTGTLTGEIEYHASS